jgi:hypothetical protein
MQVGLGLPWPLDSKKNVFVQINTMFHNNT